MHLFWPHLKITQLDLPLSGHPYRLLSLTSNAACSSHTISVVILCTNDLQAAPEQSEAPLVSHNDSTSSTQWSLNDHSLVNTPIKANLHLARLAEVEIEPCLYWSTLGYLM